MNARNMKLRLPRCMRPVTVADALELMVRNAQRAAQQHQLEELRLRYQVELLTQQADDHAAKAEMYARLAAQHNRG